VVWDWDAGITTTVDDGRTADILVYQTYTVPNCRNSGFATRLVRLLQSLVSMVSAKQASDHAPAAVRVVLYPVDAAARKWWLRRGFGRATATTESEWRPTSLPTPRSQMGRRLPERRLPEAAFSGSVPTAHSRSGSRSGSVPTAHSRARRPARRGRVHWAKPVVSSVRNFVAADAEYISLSAAIRDRRWPDEIPYTGKHHPQPYLQEPYATHIRSGRKTVEGRPGNGWAGIAKRGDRITFKITKSGGKTLKCRITDVRRFKTFKAMLQACGVQACLPGFEGTIEQAVAVYKAFGTFNSKIGVKTFGQLEKAGHGAVAITVEPLQP
jgi:ASC-1-like (ASCH) protein